MSVTQTMQTNSTRPYLIRALHEWCCDNGFTPFITVSVDNSVQVPREFVKDGEIVLNVGFDATTALSLGNDYLEFKARFGGVAREIMIPVGNVIAIFARENGQGMAFPKAHPVDLNLLDKGGQGDGGVATSTHGSAGLSVQTVVQEDASSSESSVKSGKLGRPSLTRIK